ncbi:MAG: hypothetical protein Kow00109_02740 [Acidobacteriota bacterium]
MGGGPPYPGASPVVEYPERKAGRIGKPARTSVKIRAMLRRKLALFAGLMGFGWIAACRSQPEPALPRLLEVPEFELASASGRVVRAQDLRGKVWVVDFIFTRCTGPCPLMSQRFRDLQDKLKAEGLAEAGRVRLVSISVDPGYDTPEVLSRYAEEWGADPELWWFLTGDPEYVLHLLREGFKVTAQREGSGSHNILHSTKFLLVDGKGWVRRIADYEEEGLEDSLVRDIRRLLQEETGG